MDQQTKLSLYEMTTEMDEFDNLLNEGIAGGTEDNLIIQYNLIIQSRLMEAVQTKLDKCVAYDRSLDDSIHLIDERIQALTAAKKTIQNKQNRYHDYLLFVLDSLGVTSLKGNISELKIRAASQKVEIYDENADDLIPFITTKTETVISKKDIAEKLKSGTEIKGARLVFGDRSLILKIKTN